MCFEGEINHRRVDDSLASKAKTPVAQNKNARLEGNKKVTRR
jgi:hypothetical protein